MSKELVWVEKELVGQIEVICDIIKLRGGGISEVIEKLRGDTKTYVEGLDSDLLSMKLHAQKVRDEYKAVVESEIEQSYALWEDLDKKRTQMRDKFSSMKEVVRECRGEISSLKESIDGLNIYGAERVLDLVKSFSAMTEKERDIMFKLIELGGAK